MPCEKRTVIIPIPQISKLSLREIKVTQLANMRAWILNRGGFNFRALDLV